VDGFQWKPDFRSFDVQLKTLRIDEAKGDESMGRWGDIKRMWPFHGTCPLFMWGRPERGAERKTGVAIRRTIYPNWWTK
jgi:hypothetical protein